jgi:hypothetical protein
MREHQVTARPGSNLEAQLTVTPAGVASVEPARIRFEPGKTPQVTLRGLASGGAVLRIIPTTEDLEVLGAPVAVRVLE